eukprot:1266680-Pleurochrysis_carterae.AAC.1
MPTSKRQGPECPCLGKGSRDTWGSLLSSETPSMSGHATVTCRLCLTYFMAFPFPVSRFLRSRGESSSDS